MKIMKMKAPKEVKGKVLEVYNTSIIFSIVLHLNCMDKTKINDIFPYELAPIPSVIFKDTGEARYHPTSKANLHNALKVEVSVINIIPEATLIDGCAMIYGILHWPIGAKVYDLLVALRLYITNFLSQSDVYLVFDRYKEC